MISTHDHDEMEDDEIDDALLDAQIESTLKRINLSVGVSSKNNESALKHVEDLLEKQSRIRMQNEKIILATPTVLKNAKDVAESERSLLLI